LEIKQRERIKQGFPRVDITFDFEKLIKHPHLEEMLEQKKYFSFDPIPYPFNDYGGVYKINLIKVENMTLKLN